MSSDVVALVTTTINVPLALRGYIENFTANGHSDVIVYVIGDKKTPPQAAEFCEQLNSQFPIPVRFVNIKDQERYLSRFPRLRDHLPFNSIQRRGVGFLMAYEDKARTIVTIDDDNHATEKDYLACHQIVGRRVKLPTVHSDTGWFNVCQNLNEKNNQDFYHRGFPPGQRWTRPRFYIANEDVNVVVNAGLWTGDPDIDAIARMHRPLNVTGFREGVPEQLALAEGTWHPFDSQNTALAREIVPAYFLSPYIGRYDDIWPSYLVRKIADHLGQRISYGRPLVNQARNEQDIWRNLEHERMGWELTDDFVSILRAADLGGTRGYSDCVHALLSTLNTQLHKSQRFGSHENAVRRFLEGYDIWIDAVESIGHKEA
jgi:hypothetical protein